MKWYMQQDRKWRKNEEGFGDGRWLPARTRRPPERSYLRSSGWTATDLGKKICSRYKAQTIPRNLAVISSYITVSGSELSVAAYTDVCLLLAEGSRAGIYGAAVFIFFPLSLSIFFWQRFVLSKAIWNMIITDKWRATNYFRYILKEIGIRIY